MKGDVFQEANPNLRLKEVKIPRQLWERNQDF